MLISTTVESNAVAGADRSATLIPPAVLLICVKYGADKETAQYLHSLRQLHGQQRLQVLVVDNTVEGNTKRWSEIEGYPTIEAQENLGYFGGARYALSRYLEQRPFPDWVIISNTDLAVSDPEFLNRLAEAGSLPDVGALAPTISSGLTGRDQNPFMRARPTSIRMQFYKYLYRSWLLLNAYELASACFHKAHGLFRRLTRNSHAPRNSREMIYAPHGSFLILSKHYFARGGDLEYPEFLFGEEIYVAENIRRLGLKVVYDPALRVIHEEHRSTKLFRSRKMASHVARSAAYCANTFFPLRKIHQEGAA